MVVTTLATGVAETSKAVAVTTGIEEYSSSQGGAEGGCPMLKCNVASAFGLGNGNRETTTTHSCVSWDSGQHRAWVEETCERKPLYGMVRTLLRRFLCFCGT